MYKLSNFNNSISNISIVWTEPPFRVCSKWLCANLLFGVNRTQSRPGRAEVVAFPVEGARRLSFHALRNSKNACHKYNPSAGALDAESPKSNKLENK